MRRHRTLQRHISCHPAAATSSSAAASAAPQPPLRPLRAADLLLRCSRRSADEPPYATAAPSSVSDATTRAPFFDTIIIDEATQACELSTAVALQHEARLIVLVGDHKQLPPTVRSEAAGRAGLTTSLFERLVNGAHVAARALRTPP